MLDYNFHTHTKRCGHAVGEDYEYIESAIASGYQVLGISDHSPYVDISLPKQRMSWSDYKSYIEAFQNLRTQYQSQIQLFIGFECESYEYYIDQLKELKTHCDYLILGQHQYIKDGNVHPYSNEAELRQMIKDMEYGMQEGLFLYLAHPDYYLRDRPIWDSTAEEAAHAICKLCEKYDLPMELNYNGMYRIKTLHQSIGYPYSKFWKIVGQYDCTVCIGIDAHQPERFANKDYFNDINAIIEQYHLKCVTKEELIDRIRK